MNEEDPLLPKRKYTLPLLIIICIIIPPWLVQAPLELPHIAYAWDYGTIKAPVIMHTEKTPPPPKFKVALKSYGNGTCVPYARYKTGIQLTGWAGSLLNRAEEAGYTTSSDPMIGGMIITSESRGHVAVVETIEDDTVTVSEQNVTGLHIVSTREIPLDSPIIQGYIY